MIKKGKVYIVGAGPGDPELITVKGLRVLEKADCLLYDFLSSSELLDFTKSDCKKICVGKADGLHLLEQSQINELLYESSLKHEIVVRLKGGDPFIFSRGHQEATYLFERNVEFEVIPGVTSAIAGPESAGIPLTVKNEISSVAIVTGRFKDKNAKILAPNCNTLVYLMAVSNISNVVRALLESGRSKDLACAFIEKATRHDQRVVKATISTIEEKAKLLKVKPPAVFIVGEVVDKTKLLKDLYEEVGVEQKT